MNKELDDFLVKRYPDIFKDRYGSMENTCMCWGFSCGDGWFNILNNACSLIESHINYIIKNNEETEKYLKQIMAGEKVYDWVLENYKNGELVEKPIPVFIATQVKEKFGTLRFYYSGGDEYIDGVIRMAEAMSATTCDECGGIGIAGGCGYVSTRCKEHGKDHYIETSVIVGDEIYALDFGCFINARVTEVVQEEEVIAEVLIEDERGCEINLKDKKNMQIRYIRAKYIKNSINSYWTLVDYVV